MSTDAIRRDGFVPRDSLPREEQLRFGKEIVRGEGLALLAVSDRLGDEFCRAVSLLDACPGSVIVTGMGKAGLVGQKIAATLASTGTRSHFLHAGEAVHGDLGRIHHEDSLLILSYSGETEEITRLLPSLREFGTPVVAITGHPASQLGRAATVTLDLGPLQEACALGLAPSTSTTAMLALGDALALVLSRMRRFSPRDFARFHPGGSLGRKLARVDEVMRPLVECRVACETDTVRAVFIQHSRPGRRSGAIMLVNAQGELSGLFTDSDLARLLERKRDSAIDGPIAAVMTRSPTVAVLGASVADAIETLAGRKISELPVVDDNGRPAGLIDITDLLGLLPRSVETERGSPPPEAPENFAPLTLSDDRDDADIVPFPNPGPGWPRKG